MLGLMYAIGALIFIAVVMLVAGSYMGSRTEKVRQRFDQVQGARLTPGSPIAQELQRSLYERVIGPALTRLGGLLVTASPGGATEAVKKKLEMAGNPASLSVPAFVVLRAISLVVGVLAAVVVLKMWAGGMPAHRMGLAALLALFGGMAPDYILDNIIKRRQYAITKSAPDIIDLLVVSAEAGTGLDGALMQVVNRKKGPLPDEFGRLLTEIRLGKRRQEAWSDLAERCGVDDIRNLVAALHQSEELGVSIANTLRAQADALRTRRSMRIRTVAATLSLKLLFPLIFCIFPALFVVVLGPGALTIQTAFSGLGW
jgi:tight adherence protein C